MRGDGETGGDALDEMLRAEPELAAELAEDTLALVFASRFAGLLLFDHARGEWHEWTGSYWQRDGMQKAVDWCRDLIRAASAGVKNRKTVRRAAFVRGVETLSRTDRRVKTDGSSWDADPWLLATPGGTVDLRSGLLRPAVPRDLITKNTAAVPAATAYCPRWRAFLDEACGNDRDLVGFLQRWAGYCLTGDTSEQALLFVYGKTATGKTTFAETLARIMGGYAVTAPMETFAASKFDRHPTEIAMLAGARLVIASETEEGRAWAESRIKRLTGGDQITARFIGRDNFTFVPTFKLLITGNHRPTLASPDDAIRRRVNIAPFNCAPAKQERLKEDILPLEWPGILRWAIDGCLEWQARGLQAPAVVRAATAEYLDSQDTLGLWLSECCSVADPARTACYAPVADLFASWKAFAIRLCEPPGTGKSFADALTARGFPRSESITLAGRSVRIRRGLQLPAPTDNAHHSDRAGPDWEDFS